MNVRILLSAVLGVIAASCVSRPEPATPPPSYAVVISKSAAADPAWSAVADALVKKHAGYRIEFEGSVTNALKSLADRHPRYTAFVVPPRDLGRNFVVDCHRMTRRLDADPYGDTIWGIISSASPTGALRMALATEPSVLRTGMGLTGVESDFFREWFSLSDGKAGNWCWKKATGETENGNDGNADRIRLFVGKWASIKPDALITSGHASERNLEMCFSRGNTVIRNGRWIGLENWRTPVPIEPDGHARVFVGAGNCLIGNFAHSTQTMAPALIENYSFNQFVGYVVATWYGKAGWGALALWRHLPGTYSLSEACFISNQSLIYDLRHQFPLLSGRELSVIENNREGFDPRELEGLPRDAAGMIFDRDVVAFYGDPAQRVILDRDAIPYDLTSTLREERPGRWVVEIRSGARQKGVRRDRPVTLFPAARLVGTPVVVEGAEFQPLITDDFVMVMKPRYETGVVTRVVFELQ